MAIDIVFSHLRLVMFHCYVNVYQRVGIVRRFFLGSSVAGNKRGALMVQALDEWPQAEESLGFVLKFLGLRMALDCKDLRYLENLGNTIDVLRREITNEKKRMFMSNSM